MGRVASSGDDSIHDVGKGQGGLTPTYLEECSNMTTAVDRKVFTTVGMFNEELGYAEDVDFSWRVRDAGIRILLNPRAVVRHDWGSLREDLPRAFRYGVGRVRLYRLHRSRRGALLKGDLYITVYAAFTLSLPIAIVFPAVPRAPCHPPHPQPEAAPAARGRLPARLLAGRVDRARAPAGEQGPAPRDPRRG